MSAIPHALIDVARPYLVNVDAAARAAQTAGCPWWLMCAVLEKESGGRNVFGHDAGGAMSGAGEVTEAKWKQFRQLVLVEGKTSNGVGPMQLTWPGFFTDMEKQKLKPWVIADNMLYGARLLASYWNGATGTTDQRVRQVGKRYNGSDAYGVDLVKVAKMWRARIELGVFAGATVSHLATLPLDTAYRTSKRRALWQGATVATDPRDGQRYLFQLQAQPYKGEIEHIWVHRYRLDAGGPTYLDSMRGLKFGHCQTLHVRISKYGRAWVWLGVETYFAGKKTGTKVWRIHYQPGDVTRAPDQHQRIYTGPGSAAPVSSPAGYVWLRKPGDTFTLHRESALRAHRSSKVAPKPLLTIKAPSADGTYQSSCGSLDTIYRVNGATENASMLSAFTVDGLVGHLDVTAAAPPGVKVRSEEPEAVFVLDGQVVFGKRFNPVGSRAVAYFTVASS